MAYVTRIAAPFRPLRAPEPGERNATSDACLLEGYAHLLEESGDYRVLRRLAPRVTPPFRAPNTLTALFVDVEVDPGTDSVFEFAVVPFSYAASGRIIAVHEPVVQARTPSDPDADATENGADMVVDAAAFAPLIARASIAIAHHSAHDRPYVESLLPGFALLPWACSLRDVPWRTDRGRIHRLPALAAAHGFFYDAHHACDDCLAAIELLGRPLGDSGGTALRALLRNARRDTVRLWATGAPYERREKLKKRGYRWNNGSDGRPRAWVIETDAHLEEAERRYLREEVFGRDVDLPSDRVTAYERYSNRV